MEFLKHSRIPHLQNVLLPVVKDLTRQLLNHLKLGIISNSKMSNSGKKPPHTWRISLSSTLYRARGKHTSYILHYPIDTCFYQIFNWQTSNATSIRGVSRGTNLTTPTSTLGAGTKQPPGRYEKILFRIQNLGYGTSVVQSRKRYVSSWQFGRSSSSLIGQLERHTPTSSTSRRETQQERKTLKPIFTLSKLRAPTWNHKHQLRFRDVLRHHRDPRARF